MEILRVGNKRRSAVQEPSLSKLYREHVETLERLAEDDELAKVSLHFMALLALGWRYMDPDPDLVPDGPDGGNVIRLNHKRAA